MTKAAAPDLLAWPEIREAEERSRRADEAWRRAKYRAHHAPHGKRGGRNRALSEATQEALRASAALARLRAPGG